MFTPRDNWWIERPQAALVARFVLTWSLGERHVQPAAHGQPSVAGTHTEPAPQQAMIAVLASLAAPSAVFRPETAIMRATYS
jgi:hypothetical protein